MFRARALAHRRAVPPSWRPRLGYALAETEFEFIMFSTKDFGERCRPRVAEWKAQGVVEWPKKRPSERIRRKKSPRDCSAIFRIGVTKGVGFVGNIRRIVGRAR